MHIAILILALNFQGYKFQNLPTDQFYFTNGTKSIHYFFDLDECPTDDPWPAFDDLTQQDCALNIMPLRTSDI